MNGKEAIASTLKSTQFILEMYLADFSDADMLVRPVPGANHLAWQVGHVLSSEGLLIQKQLPEAVYPPLPEGFAEKHGDKNAKDDTPAHFLPKAEYLALSKATREATLANLEKLSDADLDRPVVGPIAAYAPTLGDLFIMTANHTLMHGAQATVVRRLLGKPVLF